MVRRQEDVQRSQEEEERRRKEEEHTREQDERREAQCREEFQQLMAIDRSNPSNYSPIALISCLS